MRILLIGGFALLLATPAAAQKPVPKSTQKPVQKKAAKLDRGYVSVGGGAHAVSGTFTDRFTYTVNAENATAEARYPRKSGVLFDAGGGLRFWKTAGAAVHISRSSISGTAHTDSLIPHPFVDDRDRPVAGDAGDLTRTETAAHVQLYYERDFRRWRVRLAAGPSYFDVQQEVVTGVNVSEEYPYDIATFRSATTQRGNGSGAGFNAGADIAWMFSRRLGAGALVRFARASVDVNVNGTRRVSTDAGGAQAAAGVRVSF